MSCRDEANEYLTWVNTEVLPKKDQSLGGKASHMRNNSVKTPKYCVEIELQVPTNFTSMFVLQELTIEPKYQGEISKPCVVDLIQLVEDSYIANYWEGSFPTPSWGESSHNEQQIKGLMWKLSLMYVLPVTTLFIVHEVEHFDSMIHSMAQDKVAPFACWFHKLIL